jgi:hypothetical protein
MKTIFAILCIFSLVFFSPACGTWQKDITAKNITDAGIVSENSLSDNSIVPGMGIGKISIGNTAEYVQRTLGAPKKRVSFEEEKGNYTGYGYNIDKQLLFVIGFDYFLEYDAASNKTTYPIWKIYFRNDEVVYINISTFVYDLNAHMNSGIDRGCVFGRSADGVLGMYGGRHFFNVDEGGNHNYYFLKQGVLVIVVSGTIRVMHVFKPLTDERAANFISGFSAKPQGDRERPSPDKQYY